MFSYYNNKKNRYLFRIGILGLVISFMSGLILPVQGFAQSSVLNLPVLGTMVPPSSAFTPPMLKGMVIHPDNPLKFDFILDTGDSDIEAGHLLTESEKLIKYFLAALTVPEEEMWVNLSPYEKGRIIPDHFRQTDMGRDLLAQDYILKQLTASLIYPEDDLGSEFWNKIYQKSNTLYGTTDIPVNTFNKVWIVPENADVYINENNVFVVNSHLKVLLEEDYTALENNGIDLAKVQGNEFQTESSEIVREVIIPAIEQEVNQGENFAVLRQIYNAVILATWYKTNLKESLLTQVYADQSKTKGIEFKKQEDIQRIYALYLKAFEKGVFDYIKEDHDKRTDTTIPRRYFSGGANIASSGVVQEVFGNKISMQGQAKKLSLELEPIISGNWQDDEGDQKRASSVVQEFESILQDLKSNPEHVSSKPFFDKALAFLRENWDHSDRATLQNLHLEFLDYYSQKNARILTSDSYKQFIGHLKNNKNQLIEINTAVESKRIFHDFLGWVFFGFNKSKLFTIEKKIRKYSGDLEMDYRDYQLKLLQKYINANPGMIKEDFVFYEILDVLRHKENSPKIEAIKLMGQLIESNGEYATVYTLDLVLDTILNLYPTMYGQEKLNQLLGEILPIFENANPKAFSGQNLKNVYSREKNVLETWIHKDSTSVDMAGTVISYFNKANPESLNEESLHYLLGLRKKFSNVEFREGPILHDRYLKIISSYNGEHFTARNLRELMFILEEDTDRHSIDLVLKVVKVFKEKSKKAFTPELFNELVALLDYDLEDFDEYYKQRLLLGILGIFFSANEELADDKDLFEKVIGGSLLKNKFQIQLQYLKLARLFIKANPSLANIDDLQKFLGLIPTAQLEDDSEEFANFLFGISVEILGIISDYLKINSAFVKDIDPSYLIKFLSIEIRLSSWINQDKVDEILSLFSDFFPELKSVLELFKALNKEVKSYPKELQKQKWRQFADSIETYLIRFSSSEHQIHYKEMLSFLRVVHGNLPNVLADMNSLNMELQGFRELRKNLPVNNALTRVIRLLAENKGGYLSLIKIIQKTDRFNQLYDLLLTLAFKRGKAAPQYIDGVLDVLAREKSLIGALDALSDPVLSISSWSEEDWVQFRKDILQYIDFGLGVPISQFFNYFRKHRDQEDLLLQFKQDIASEMGGEIAWGNFKGFSKEFMTKYQFTLNDELTLLSKFMVIKDRTVRDFGNTAHKLKAVIVKKGESWINEVDSSLRSLYSYTGREVVIQYQSNDDVKFRDDLNQKLVGWASHSYSEAEVKAVIVKFVANEKLLDSDKAILAAYTFKKGGVESDRYQKIPKTDSSNLTRLQEWSVLLKDTWREQERGLRAFIENELIAHFLENNSIDNMYISNGSPDFSDWLPKVEKNIQGLSQGFKTERNRKSIQEIAKVKALTDHFVKKLPTVFSEDLQMIEAEGQKYATVQGKSSEKFYLGFFDDFLHLMGCMATGVCTWDVRHEQVEDERYHFGTLALKNQEGRILIKSQVQLLKLGLKDVAEKKSLNGWQVLSVVANNIIKEDEEGNNAKGQFREFTAMLELAQRLADKAGMQAATLVVNDVIHAQGEPEHSYVKRLMAKPSGNGWLSEEVQLSERVLLSHSTPNHPVEYSYKKVFIIQIPENEFVLEESSLDEILNSQNGESSSALGVGFIEDIMDYSSRDAKGGVDLNPNNIQLNIHGEDRIQFDTSFDNDSILNLNIQGFKPVILDIQPIMNLPLLMGLIPESHTEVDSGLSFYFDRIFQDVIIDFKSKELELDEFLV